MVVLSGSMSGNAEDHIEVGDLIFDVKPDIASLKEGDIISFMDGKTVVTHRIVKLYTDSDRDKKGNHKRRCQQYRGSSDKHRRYNRSL